MCRLISLLGLRGAFGSRCGRNRYAASACWCCRYVVAVVIGGIAVVDGRAIAARAFPIELLLFADLTVTHHAARLGFILLFFSCPPGLYRWTAYSWS